MVQQALTEQSVSVIATPVGTRAASGQFRPTTGTFVPGDGRGLRRGTESHSRDMSARAYPARPLRRRAVLALFRE